MLNLKIGEEVLYFSRKDTEFIHFPMSQCIDILEGVHKSRANGKVDMPAKPYLGDPMTNGFLSAYVAEIKEPAQIGIKWLGGRPSNRKYNIPALNSLIILNDPDTFCPIAIMDGNYITGMRTAGVSGIAMRHFALADSRVMTVLGYGYQGKMHIAAANATLPSLEEIYIWGPNVNKTEQFIREMKELFDYNYILSRDPREAIRKSDVVISSTPLGDAEQYAMIKDNCFKEGATVISISRANHFFPSAFLSFDKYFVDESETMQLISERTHFESCADLTTFELGDYLIGKFKGRDHCKQRIMFVSDGMGINDVSVAHAILSIALKHNVGTVLPL